MTAFVKNMKNKERPRSAPQGLSARDIKQICGEMLDNRLSDIYKYIDTQTKKKKPPPLQIDNIEVEKPDIIQPDPIEKADEPLIIIKKIKRKMMPLILPKEFSRKSIHELTESSIQKIQPKLVMMDKFQKIGY